MKVVISAPSVLEMEHVEVKEQSISGKPLFYGMGRDATAFVVKVTSDDGTKVLKVGTLRVNGKTGAISYSDRTKPVVPVMERVRKTDKAAPRS